MDIRILGPLEIEGNDGPLGPRDRVVLSALVANREPLSADQLAEALWGDDPPASAAKVVQGCVSRLRKRLGTDAIATVPTGYRLAVAADRIDAVRFERQVARGHELLALGEPERAAYALQEALSLWRGEPLDDLNGWPPGRDEQERLQQLRLDAEDLRIEASLQAGRADEVLQEALVQLRREPLRERRWGQLALAQYRTGRQADALDTLRTARTVLADELGIDPGPELVGLEQAILRQAPSLVVEGSGTSVSTTCPWPGLVTYDVEDADGFHGRDQDIRECLATLESGPLLAIVGPSGSGKSSLARAGVVAALRRDRRAVLIITPGRRPLEALSVVPSTGPVPVLVVDQAEEAFTLCEDVGERTAFLDGVAAHAERGKVVLTLRADRFGELSRHPAVARLAEGGLHLVKALDGDGLRAAIEEPARQAGLLLEAGLVDLLIRDVEGGAGALPLLSHALRQTWLRREGRVLTVDAYRATGGIRGAVAQSAEELYERADEQQRAAIHDVLLRLVTTSAEDSEPVRNRLPRRLLAGDPAQDRVLEQLVRARLVTSDDGVVEIAHEAIARAWPRLRSWLDEDLEGQRIWRHLTVAADTWQTMGRPDSELYRGTRLERTWAWYAAADRRLSPVERSFLESSHGAAEAERVARQRRRRRTLVGLVGVAVVMALLAVLALVGQQRAGREADVARARELVASAVAVMGTDPALAKLLALASADHARPTVDTTSVLHRALAQDRVSYRYQWQGGFAGPHFGATLSPDGALLAAVNGDSTEGFAVEVTEIDTDTVLWRWEVAEPGLITGQRRRASSPVAFTPEGQLAVGVLVAPGHHDDPPGSEHLGVLVWEDARTGGEPRRVDIGGCGAEVIDAGSGGISVERCIHQGAREPGYVDLRSGEYTKLFGSTTMAPIQTGGRSTLSGDGWRFSSGEIVQQPPAILVKDVRSGDDVARIPFTAQLWGMFDLNHDGSLLLLDGDPIVVWDVEAGEQASAFHDRGVASFAPDGETVWSTDDIDLLHRDARTGRELARYSGVVGSTALPIAAGSRVLTVDASTGRAAVLDTGPVSELWHVDTECSATLETDLIATDDTAYLGATGCPPDSGYATTTMIDLERREVSAVLRNRTGYGTELSPDGSRLVQANGTRRPPSVPAQLAGEVDHWTGSPSINDAVTGEVLVELEGVCGAAIVYQAVEPRCATYPETPFPFHPEAWTWSPDSTRVAGVAWEGGVAVVWDARTGDLLGSTAGCAFSSSIRFAPSGEELLVGCLDRISMISTDSWEEVDSVELSADLHAPELAGPTADSSSYLFLGEFWVGGETTLVWADPTTFEVQHTLPRIHTGSVNSYAWSPDRAQLATGGADGIVKVWDVERRTLVHEFTTGGSPVQGLAFLDDHRVAAAPLEGGMYVYTLDPDELLGVVGDSLTRGFTPLECVRFNFGEECPTLEDQRALGR